MYDHDHFLGEFEDWLRRAAYADSTVYTTVASARRLLNGEEELPYYVRTAAIRMGVFCEEEGWAWPEEAAPEMTRLIEMPQSEKRRQRRTERKKKEKTKEDRKSFSEEEWATLVRHLEEEAHRNVDAACLLVLARTGLRANDLLLLRKDALQAGQHTNKIHLTQKGERSRVLPFDGAPEAWAAVWKHWRGRPEALLWELVAPGASRPRSGYAALRRYLLRAADQLGLEGKVHLHRLRRTGAVRVAQFTGGDVVAVQRFLGHEQLSSTAAYLNEAREDDLRDLQQRLAGRAEKKDPEGT